MRKWKSGHWENLKSTPTEEETFWLRKHTDITGCETEEDVMPFFKTIIKNRILADRGM